MSDVLTIDNLRALQQAVDSGDHRVIENQAFLDRMKDLGCPWLDSVVAVSNYIEAGLYTSRGNEGLHRRSIGK